MLHSACHCIRADRSFLHDRKYFACAGELMRVELAARRRRRVDHGVEIVENTGPDVCSSGTRLDQDHRRLPAPQLDAQGVGEALESKFRCTICTGSRGRDSSAERGNEYRPSVNGPQQRTGLQRYLKRSAITWRGSCRGLGYATRTLLPSGSRPSTKLTPPAL